MKFILFGAGRVGQIALLNLGEKFVECFADNMKSGTFFCGKPVISFEEMVALADTFRIVIATTDYEETLAAQLEEAGIKNYLFYPNRNRFELQSVLPTYGGSYDIQHMSYTDILYYYQIFQYRKIAIWGTNEYIDYLLLEIALLSDLNNVVGIMESTPSGQSDYLGIPYLSLDQTYDIDCLIINQRRTDTNIRDILETKEVNFNIIDLYDVSKFVTYTHHPELSKFKDIHKGRRAFIIGNGPSLTIDDLNTLHQNNEICFAANNIHKIYNQTAWRPNYLCMSDLPLIHEKECIYQQLAENSVLFATDYFIPRHQTVPNMNPVHIIQEEYAPNLPNFSGDITRGVYMGFSVLYNLCLQVAPYMGISEIYLLGVDHNMENGATLNQADHFIKNYLSDKELETRNSLKRVWYSDNVTLAYERAELYSRKHGFRIYNATRGGKLEVFERVDFDSLF